MKTLLACLPTFIFLASNAQLELSGDIDPDFSTGINAGMRAVLLLDKDSDGDLDIFATPWVEVPRIYWYENLGSGVFGARQVFYEDGFNVRHFNTADIDQDGDLDLHVSSSNPELGWFENLGNGSFVTHYLGNGLNNTIKHSTFLLANNDEFPDMAIVDCEYGDSTHFAIYLNDQNGSFVYGSPLEINGGFEGDVQAGDLDQDGDLDILLSRTVSDKAVWFENLGNGSFGPPLVLMENVGYMYSASIKDYDQDGINDIFLCGGSLLYLYLFKGLGGGDFSGPIEIEYFPSIVYITWGDLDSDGDEDGITVSNNGDMHFLENQGNGEFAAPVVYPRDPYAAMAEIGDLNGDGTLDVLLSALENDFLPWYANQAGLGCTAVGACNYDPSAVFDNNTCSFPAIGDLNCDGQTNNADIDALIMSFGCTQNCGNNDLDGDGQIGMSDIYILISLL